MITFLWKCKGCDRRKIPNSKEQMPSADDETIALLWSAVFNSIWWVTIKEQIRTPSQTLVQARTEQDWGSLVPPSSVVLARILYPGYRACSWFNTWFPALASAFLWPDLQRAETIRAPYANRRKSKLSFHRINSFSWMSLYWGIGYLLIFGIVIASVICSAPLTS